jgi:hypothetical protein
MNLKSRVGNQVASVVNELEQQAEALPAHIDDAKIALADWRHRARRFVRENPGTAVIGAFAIGVIVAKAARHV